MLENLKNKNILLGITGSIAAYKALELTRLLIKNNANVKVVMTKSALELIQPVSFASLSKNQVYTAVFQEKFTQNIEHIELAKWADIVLIAPATANIIAKINHGLADDLLTTICLAVTAPIFIAPAMNKEMWHNKITQENINSLTKKDIKFIGPSNGLQACGDVGDGRMSEPNEIINAIANYAIEPLFANKKIMITAGPTVEAIDPVRFISNHSSGKMGYAIAEVAKSHQANVTLISGPTNLSPPSGIKVLKIKTALEMYEAVMTEIKNSGCDIFISVAAVADYRVETINNQKIKKDHESKLKLTLIKNPDILEAVAKLEKPPFTIGFAAETDNLIANAKEKLQRKNIDVIVANIVCESKGFNSDENSVTIIAKNAETLELEKKNKLALAFELMKFIYSLFSSGRKNYIKQQ